MSSNVYQFAEFLLDTLFSPMFLGLVIAVLIFIEFHWYFMVNDDSYRVRRTRHRICWIAMVFIVFFAAKGVIACGAAGTSVIYHHRYMPYQKNVKIYQTDLDQGQKELKRVRYNRAHLPDISYDDLKSKHMNHRQYNHYLSEYSKINYAVKRNQHELKKVERGYDSSKADADYYGNRYEELNKLSQDAKSGAWPL